MTELPTVSISGARFKVKGFVTDGFTVWATLHDGQHYTTEGVWSVPLVHLNEFLSMYGKRFDPSGIAGIQKRLSMEWLASAKFPPTIITELKSHQTLGSRFILNRVRSAVLDEMGTGKTALTLESALQLLRNNKIDRVLVMATSSGRYVWLREMKKWGFDKTEEKWVIPEFDNVQLLESPYKNIPDQISGEAKFVLGGYDIFSHRPEKKGIGIACDSLLADAKVRRYMIVADEAHLMGNYLSNRSIYLRVMNATWRVALTGTPIGNRVEEAFSILSFLEGHEMWNGFRNFAVEYLVYSEEKFGPNRAVTGYKNVARLANALLPISIRRLKKDVTDLPPITESWIDVKLSDEEEQVYTILREMFDDEVKQFRAGSILAHTLEFGAYTITKMFLAHPMLLEKTHSDIGQKIFEEYLSPPKSMPHSKFDAFGEFVEEILDQNDHATKVVVFCDFPRVLEWMTKLLPDNSWAMFHGQTPGPERDRQMERFNDDPECQWILLSDAGTSSVNLPASYVVHYTLPWSLITLNQRRDRASRMGHNMSLTALKMIVKGEESMDELIARTLEKKKALSDKLLKGIEDASRPPPDDT